MCLYHCTKLTLKEINTKFISLILYFTARSGPKNRKNGAKQTFFEKKRQNIWSVLKNSLPLHPQSGKQPQRLLTTMVARTFWGMV
jgi:hypothetical protein